MQCADIISHIRMVEVNTEVTVASIHTLCPKCQNYSISSARTLVAFHAFFETHAAPHIIRFNLSISDCLEMISIRFAHSECSDSNGNSNNNNNSSAPTSFSNLSRIAAVASIGWKVLPMLELRPTAEKRRRKVNTSGKMRYNSGTQKFFQASFSHHINLIAPFSASERDTEKNKKTGK